MLLKVPLWHGHYHLLLDPVLHLFQFIVPICVIFTRVCYTVLNPKEQEALLKSKLHDLQATTAFKRAQKIQLA